MPGAWDDERPRAEDGYVFDAPAGADPTEELEHELALAAALDRSRPSLSPDAPASDRMRRRLFEAMAAEGFGALEGDLEGVGRAESEHAAIRCPAPAPTPSELTAPLGSPLTDTAGPATRPVGPPVPDVEPDVSGASVTRAAGEHTVAAGETAGAAGAAGTETRGRRRARHVLPSDHPDNPDQGKRTGRNRSRPPRRDASDASTSGRRRPGLRKRFGMVVTAVAALAVLAGVTATMSKDALPGDALYGVKRVTESTGGIFTFGDQAEATRQLDIARTRMDEIQGLLQRGDAPDSAAITTAMDDFDTATGNGSRMILSAERTAGGSELADLRTWATAQSGRMEEMRSSLPSANAADADESKALLDRVLVRTEALRARTGCAEGGTASVDDLGPLPSTEPCATAGGGPASIESDGTTGEGTPGSSEQGSTGSTSPETSTDGTTPSDGASPENGALLPPLVGEGPARSETDESTSDSSTSSEDEPLEDGITFPPLLPGLGPVTLG